MINLSEIEKQKAIVVREIEKLEEELIEKDVTMMCSSENVECTPLKDVKEAIEECWFIKDGETILIEEDEETQDVRLGDYISYYSNVLEEIVLGKIIENGDNQYQVFYSNKNSTDYCIYNSIEELIDDYSDNEDFEILKVYNKKVTELNTGTKYLLFRNGEVLIVECNTSSGCCGDSYDLFTDGEIVESAENLDDLFLETVKNYEIIEEIRDDKYDFIMDDEVCEELSEIVLKSYIDSYKNVKLDNYQMIDLGENIIRYSRLNKKDIINIMNDNHIEAEKWFGVTEAIDSFLEDRNEYFLDDKTGIWYPNNLGLFPGDNILNYRDCETYEVVLVNNKYALCNNRTNKMHEKMYDTIKDMVDELFDCNYDEMMRLYKRIK